MQSPGRALLVLALVFGACSGGGGFGGFPHTLMALNTTVNGSLAAGDIVAPDMSFIDLYLIEPGEDGTLTITQRSAEIDSFLFLFTSACLNDGNMGNWGTYLLGLDDDSGGGVNGFDAMMTGPITAGSFVIGANSFGVETGNYDLEALFSTTDGEVLPLEVQRVDWATAKALASKTR